MGELLYLDTARLGRMSPGARRAHLGFAELAAEEGGSAYVEQFLRAGADALPLRLQDRYPGLGGWQGVGPLKEALGRLAGQPPGFPVLLANRSAQLMKLAARLLFHPCRNVLTTDFGWPGYHDILVAEGRRANRTVTVVPLRHAVTVECVGKDELVERVSAAFTRHGCDGLFLTAVSSDGVRLPVGRIVRTLEAAQYVRFVAVDGAQDFCHAGADLRHCDLYLTGAHKWLGGYLPLGVGFCGRRRSRGLVETVAARMAGAGDLDDPLLGFADAFEAGRPGRPVETVNLGPLLSCQGAAADAVVADAPAVGLAGRLDNLSVASMIAAQAGWQPVVLAEAFRSGILLLRADAEGLRRVSPEKLGLEFRKRGLALSAYNGGVVRVSMPAAELTAGERGVVRDTLDSVLTDLSIR